MALSPVPLELLPAGRALVYGYVSRYDARPHPLLFLGMENGSFGFYDYNLRVERRSATPRIIGFEGVLSERALRFMAGLGPINTEKVIRRVRENQPIYDFFTPANRRN